MGFFIPCRFVGRGFIFLSKRRSLPEAVHAKRRKTARNVEHTGFMALCSAVLPSAIMKRQNRTQHDKTRQKAGFSFIIIPSTCHFWTVSDGQTVHKTGHAAKMDDEGKITNVYSVYGGKAHGVRQRPA